MTNGITLTMVREGLTNGAIDGDGHGIVSPAYYAERGFPLALVKHLERRIRSGAGKYAITRPDETIGDVTGISSLTFHFFIANSLGLTYDEKLGRGSQARSLRQAISAWAGVQ